MNTDEKSYSCNIFRHFRDVKKDLYIDGIHFLTAREAGDVLGYAPDYISRLCREGKLKGRLSGKNWLVEADSLIPFIKQHEAKKQAWHQDLSRELKSVAEPVIVRDESFEPLSRANVAPRQLHILRSSEKAHHTREVAQTRTIARIAGSSFVAVLLLFVANVTPLSSHIANAVHGVSAEDSLAAASSVFSPIESIARATFNGINTVVCSFSSWCDEMPESAVVYVRTPGAPNTATAPTNPVATNITNNISNYIQPVIERLNGVSEQSLASRLLDLETSLTGRIDLALYEGRRQTEDLADQFSDGIGGGGFDDIDITDSTFTGGSISGASLSGVSFSGEQSFDALSVEDATSTNATSTNLYVSGSFGFGSDTGLLRNTAGSVSTLANGSNGQVLKMVSGNLQWATDLTGGGGGGSSFFSTTTDDLAIYPADPSHVVIIGDSSTTTIGNILEIAGNSLFRGAMTSYGDATAPRFVATSSVASLLPYASTTMITATTASTTNLVVSGISGSLLKTNAQGQVVSAIAGTDYLDTTANLFSTTSADYWETQQTSRSADDLSDNSIEDLNDVAAMTENYGDLLFWDGTSWADIATSSLGLVTSGDLGAYFSLAAWYATTTDGLAQGVTNRYYDDSLVQTYLTTLDKGFFFSTTSASYFLSQNQGSAFSTTSAINFVHSSTTIPKTYTSNTFTALQNFTNASSTLFSASYASTTNLFASTASTTNLTISGLSNGLLKVDASGAVSLAVAGTDYTNFAYLFPNNATSTTLTFNNGLMVVGSTTINGNATTTGMLGVGSLFINNEQFSDLTGTGLTNANGVLTLNATGNWTGTFDNQEGTYYLDRANHTGSQLASTISDFNTAVNSFIHASTTIPKTYTSNTFTALQTFNSGLTTNAFTLGSLNGPLQANNGVVSATTSIGVLYGGTGLTSAPTYGQLLVGNASGGYTLTSTSSLGISSGSAFSYLFPSNATSTTLTFSNGLLSLASTTIGNGTQAGGLTIAGGATTTGSLSVGIGTSTFAGDILMSGSIIPSIDNTYSLGSESNMWKDVYIGPGSLYVNGKKVIEDVSDTITFSTDNDQSLMTETSGVGTVTTRATGSGNANLLTGSGNINLTSTSGNINIGTSGSGQLNFGTVTSGTWNGTTIGDAYLTKTGNWTGTLDGYEASQLLDGAFSTTSASYFLSQNQGNAFSTTSAINFIHSSTTIPKLYSSNTWTGSNVFNSLTLGTLNGPLHANAGVVSATSSIGVLYGGTGLTTAPAYGQLLVGNASGGYTLTATSSLGISTSLFTDGGATTYLTSSDNLGLGTTTANSKLTVYGDLFLEGTDRYTNFGTTTGTNGYGFRDNAGVMEFKNANGTWQGVTTATTGPTFLVNKNGSNQGSITGTQAKVTWSEAAAGTFDTNNNFDDANDRFQPTVPGKYMVSASALFANDASASGVCFLEIYKNGSTVALIQNSTTVASGSFSCTVSTIVDANGTSDYIEVFASQSGSDGNIYGNATFSYFTGTMIAPVNGNNAAGWANDGSASFLLDNADRVGIGTTTPWAKLAIQATGSQTNPLFEIASSSSATKFLSVAGDGFGTTTLSGLTISGSATSTSNVGFNLTGGCYAVGGVCLGGGSSSFEYLFPSNATSTLLSFNGGLSTSALTLGTLNGPLHANNGVVSATSSIGVLYGGTGLTTAPNYGQLLIGNGSGGYTLTATSSLGLGSGASSSAGGGQLLAIYSTSTPGSNVEIDFSGPAGSAPSFSGGALALPSNTSHVVVEIWGAGGGGGEGETGSSGSAGGQSCFGTNTTACTTPILNPSGGSGGNSATANGGAAGGGGSASNGDVAISGGGGSPGEQDDATTPRTGTGGSGGSAGGGGGPGGGGGATIGAGDAGSSFGGGGGGGGGASAGAGGGGGGGGGYEKVLISNPAAGYYYTLGAGGAGGTGSTGGDGGRGGAGGIIIHIYTTGISQGAIGSGSAGFLPYFTSDVASTSLSATSTLFLATNGNFGIGSTTPWAKLSVQATGAQTNPLFEIASSSSVTKFLSVSATGFGTTTVSGLNISGSATTTSNVGMDITSGCYAVGGVCLGGGASLSGTTGQLAYFSGTDTAVGTSTLFIDTSGRVGVGTTSPLAALSSYGDLFLDGASRYINFGATSTLGVSGYGFRDNAGVMEFKNSGGTWQGVTTATTGPSFSVHKGGSSQTVTTNTWTQIVWSTELFDTNNNFDLSTERFTPTVPGKYMVSLAARCVSTTARCLAGIYKNGSPLHLSQSEDGSNSNPTAIVTAIVDMNGSTDYLEGYGFNGGGTSIDGDALQTYFSGAMIAPVNGNNAAGWANDGNASFLLDNADRVGIGTTTPWSKLALYGDLFIEGTDRYLNFGTATGTDGYGIRDNAGTLEFKNSAGSWTGFGTGSGSGGGARLTAVHTYTSDTTWNKPDDLDYVIVKVVGAGGGGGGSGTTANRGGSGGGGGGYSQERIDASSLGSSETVTVGTAGAAQTGTGLTGETSSFGAYLQATGGTGGPSAGGANGGVGGVGSGGDINIEGSDGQTASVQIARGGHGGDSHLGGGGSGGQVDSAGLPGNLYGGGGGGSPTTDSSQTAGAAGADGVVIVYEYSQTDDTQKFTTSGITTSLATTSDYLAVGTSTAYSKLTAWGGANGNIFEAVTSASTTAFMVANNGDVGVGTTSPAARLAVGGIGYFGGTSGTTTIEHNANVMGFLKVGTNSIFLNGNGTSSFSGGIQTGALVIEGATATSTSNVGMNITSGCYAVGGVCLSSESFAYPFSLADNATSTLTQFNGGLTAYASSTIGAGGQATGLTINGGATTTGSLYVGSNIGIGTASPTERLHIFNSSTARLLVGDAARTLQVGVDGDVGAHYGLRGGNGISFADAGDLIPIALDASGGTTFPDNNSALGRSNIKWGGLFVNGLTVTGGNTTVGGTLTLGSLNGPLHANAGVVSATSSIGVLYGGTGLTTAPAYGQLLLGQADGTYMLTATSSLGIAGGSTDTGNVPAGTIAAFASTTCPVGWTEYEAARGRFLRGIDNGAGIDPDGTRAPGHQQADGAPNITGSITNLSRHTFPAASGAFSVSMTGDTGRGIAAGSGIGTLSFSAANSSAKYGAATEIRPANVAVLYCESTGSSALENGQVVSGLTGQVPFYSADGTLLSATSSLFIASSTNIGIGTTSPWAKFSINSTAGIPQFVIGSSTTQFIVDASGSVGIGTTSPRRNLTVTGTGQFTSNVYVGVGDENPVGNNVAGVVLSDIGTLNINRIAGTSAHIGRSDDGTIVAFYSAASNEGTISVSGTTVSYNAFTGSHYGTTNEEIERGMLVELDGTQTFKHGDSDSEPTYGIRKTSAANSPTVFGSLLSLMEPSQSHDVIDNPYLIMAVGNGDMWVVQGEEAAIEAGDYLISSNLAGHAMKDPGTYMVSHIVARAAQKVEWDSVASTTSDGLKRMKISVTFEQFDRNAALSEVLTAMTASSTATSTEETEVQQFATGFMANLFSRMTDWLADAGNGITEIFAKTLRAENVYADTVNANMLCLEDLCVTKAELQQMLDNSGTTPAQAPVPEEPAPPAEEPVEEPTTEEPPTEEPDADTPESPVESPTSEPLESEEEPTEPETPEESPDSEASVTETTDSEAPVDEV